MDIDKSLLEDFISEAREHLDTLEDNLMLLEEQIDNPDKEMVNTLFRAAHTIKGGAGFLGLTKIGKLAHSMENLLANVRDGEAKADLSYIDALLDSLDTLRAMVDNAEDSNDTDISNQTATIEEILGKGQEKSKEENAQKMFVAENGESWAFDPAEIKSIPKSNSNYFLLTFDFIELENKLNLNPYEVISMITKITYMIHGSLDTADLQLEDADKTESLNYKLFLCTDKSKENLSSQLPENSIKQILSVKLVDNYIPNDKKEEQISQNKDSKIIKDTSSVTKEEKEKEIVATDKMPQKIAKAINKKSVESSSKSVKHLNQTLKLKLDLIEELMTLTGELVLDRNRIMLLTENSKDQDLLSTVQHLDTITSELQSSIMLTRMQPIGNVFHKYPRIIRDLAKKLGKKIELVVKGADAELDKTLVDSLADPMTHLIRNSCDHGIEMPDVREMKGKEAVGTITLNAFHESGQINIVIEDDGGGIDVEKISQIAVKKGLKTEEEIAQMNKKQKLNLIMLPGFSTADKISDVSGRGVGMDVVKSTIEKLGGNFELESEDGKGSTVTLRMPLTLAIMPSFIIESQNKKFAIPQVSIEEIVTLKSKEELQYGVEWEIYRLREELIPIVRLNEVLANSKPFDTKERKKIIENHQTIQDNMDDQIVLVLRSGKSKFGLIVDKILNIEEIVVKPLHRSLKEYAIYAGATLMGDGNIALILNADGISRHTGTTLFSETEEAEQKELKVEDLNSIFVFKTNENEQYAMDLKEIIRIEKIESDKIEKIGDQEFISINDKSHSIVKLNKFLNMGEAKISDEMFFILLKHASKPTGLLVSEIVDTVFTNSELDTEAYKNPYIIGTKTVADKMTLFLNTKSFY